MFESLIRDVLVELHLDEDYLGESVTVQEPDKPARTVVVHIEEDEDVRVDIETGKHTRIDLIDVLVLRDESHAKGGISEPKIGTWIQRSVDVDPSMRRYYFKGDVKHRKEHKMHIMCERIKILADGPGGK
jgi:hypothetical protein